MPKIVSHRGANRFAPENTFAAADLALQQGADYIELDVRERGWCALRFSRRNARSDHKRHGTDRPCPVERNRCAGCRRLVWRKLQGAVVPRLDAYLRHLRGRCGVYIELKYCDPVKVAALVRDLGMVRDTFFFSFSEDMRRGLAAAAPEFRKMMTLDIAKSPSLAAAVHHASIIEITPAQMRRPGLVEACRKAGLDVMVYDGGDDIDLHNEIALAGVDYVNIDRPDLFDTARRTARLPELA